MENMNKKAIEIKSEVEMKLANEFGNYMETMGVKHLFGRIYGLLIAQVEPISLKEIAEKLEVSKPAVSTTVKIGLELGMIQKSYNPKMPREYFFSLNMHSMDMIIDPGLKKLDMLNQKINIVLKQLQDYGKIVDTNDELRLLKDTLKWLNKTHQIIYEEYIIYSERVKERMNDLKNENK